MDVQIGVGDHVLDRRHDERKANCPENEDKERLQEERKT
jgi:hypothetical protein